jgi:hypothetical protein
MGYGGMPAYGAPGIGANMGYPGANMGYPGANMGYPGANMGYSNPVLGKTMNTAPTIANVGISSPAAAISNAS